MEENSEIGMKRRKLKAELEELEAFEIKFEQLVLDTVRGADEDEEESSVTAAAEEGNDRSDTGECEQSRYRQQSPISDLLERRGMPNIYNNTNEMREAEKRGKQYINGLSQDVEV